MKTVHLDLRDVTSPEVLHSVLARRLELPDYYGRNLDALSDCLGDVCEPTHVLILCGADAAQCVNGALRVFDDSQKSNNQLSVSVFRL